MSEKQQLFSEFKPATYEEWYAEAVKLLKGAPFDKKMFTKTPEGITLKPIYNRSDVDFEIALPGYGNYVRGTKADGNKVFLFFAGAHTDKRTDNGKYGGEHSQKLGASV